MLPIPPDTLLQQRYRILNMLGEGGFGRTYLATDRARTNATERADAEEFCEIQEFIPTSQIPGAITKAKEFFKQQAILLYQLQHPQVPRFWATFEEQGRLFLVLDYIEGKTYGQLLEERRDAGEVFSETEVWQLLLQVVPVLGYIHSKGVIHREISPENIICRSSDRLPVPSDFGAVREFADKLHANSDTSMGSGKPYYAPSEQFTSGKLSPSSDFYALAVTAIVLVTGKEPSALFTGDRMNWDWRKWTQISDGLADVLQRMLNADPNARYQAAIEIYRDLQDLVMPTSEPAAPAAIPAPLGARPSELPTVALGATPQPEAPKRPQTAITHLNAKSIWEKPQVFIPLGILISLLAGLGSWLAVGYFLRNKPPEQTATTPPKQIDFNNPTIPTDSNPSPTDGAATDTIQPILDREVIKEGTVDAAKPIRYKFAATSGQNLDIKLLSGGSSSPSPAAIDSPIPGIPGAVPTQSPTAGKSSPSPSSSIAPITPTQVLLSVLSPTGSPIDAQADRVVGWRGQIPTDGEYTIELRPIAGLSGKSYPYKLSVTQLASLPSTSPSASPELVVPTISPTASPESIIPSTSPTASPESIIPSTSPTASPDSGTPATSPESVIPSTGSTPPLTIPVPSGSGDVNSTPTPTSSPSNSPTVSPSSNTNTGSTRRTRRRRVRQTESDSTPQVRQRQTDSSSDETPRRRRRRVTTNSSSEENTTTRRRTQVESSTQETTTPRRRRRRTRVANTQSTTSTPTTTPKSENSDSNNIPNGVPIEVPSPSPEPIAVPSPRNNSVPASGSSNDSN
jgi:serine/threonine protein kinase